VGARDGLDVVCAQIREGVFENPRCGLGRVTPSGCPAGDGPSRLQPLGRIDVIADVHDKSRVAHDGRVAPVLLANAPHAGTVVFEGPQ